MFLLAAKSETQEVDIETRFLITQVLLFLFVTNIVADFHILTRFSAN